MSRRFGGHRSFPSRHPRRQSYITLGNTSSPSGKYGLATGGAAASNRPLCNRNGGAEPFRNFKAPHPTAVRVCRVHHSIYKFLFRLVLRFVLRRRHYPRKRIIYGVSNLQRGGISLPSLSGWKPSHVSSCPPCQRREIGREEERVSRVRDSIGVDYREMCYLPLAITLLQQRQARATSEATELPREKYGFLLPLPRKSIYKFYV